MFCGSAAGAYLPPMAVYKAQNIYTNWRIGGPEGTVYDATKSGWFDSRTFEIWFMNVFLPNISKLSGPKLLIGDNVKQLIFMVLFCSFKNLFC